MATILLAEDNEAVRLLTQAKLRHQFTVVTAANGRETLDILNRQHVDLIVADVMMPVMDGYQLVRTLRAEGNEIPVLFLTALQSMDSKREGFSSGIDDYLTKPVDYEELIWRIQALLRRAHIAILSQSAAALDGLKQHGQVGERNAHAAHDLHDLAVFCLQLFLFQFLEPCLLLVDLGHDLFNLGLNFCAFGDSHKKPPIKIIFRRRRNGTASNSC